MCDTRSSWPRGQNIIGGGGKSYSYAPHKHLPVLYAGYLWFSDPVARVDRPETKCMPPCASQLGAIHLLPVTMSDGCTAQKVDGLEVCIIATFRSYSSTQPINRSCADRSRQHMRSWPMLPISVQEGSRYPRLARPMPWLSTGSSSRVRPGLLTGIF